MPQNNNREVQDFSKYDAMTSEELAQILRLDSEAPEGNELDIDTLLYITGVLAERQKISNNTGKTAQEAWNSFQQNYLPSKDELSENTEDTKLAKPRRPWVRRAIAAAALVALMVCIPLTAKALNWKEIWNAVATWAKETFSFVSTDQPETGEPVPDNTRQYNSLSQTLEQMDMAPNLVPTWIPEGYVLDRIDVEETPFQCNIIALYQKGEESMNICIRSYVESDPEKVEINEDLIDKYEVAGIEYYIFANNEWVKTVWIQGSYECYISGELSIEEIKQMIESIPEG